MIVELGHYALVLVLTLAIVQAALQLWAALSHDRTLMATGSALSLAQMVFALAAFGALMQAYIVSDFSVMNVVANSHSTKPLLYRITGVWGNHEGSVLLWLVILTLFGASVGLSGKKLPGDLRAATLSVQAMLSAAFALFLLFTSNPFLRMAGLPGDGRDLNPLLQDIGLAIHPPLLYLGYVGFSICYSFAMGALITGRIDAAFARLIRPWILGSWIFLTLGIAMGSYWAYYELGWGGWWFWDPVENASFMPWLAGTMLLHSALVMEKRDALKRWTLLLAILTFSLSLLGTFLVRSGVLTSVHAFAVDPARGAVILFILGAFIGGGFALYAWRAPLLAAGGAFAPISREGALVLNNVLLSCAVGSVFAGTLYPLLLEVLTGDKISVGPPYFNLTFGLSMAPLLLALPFGPFMAWKRGDLAGAAQRLLFAAILSACAIGFILWQQNGAPVLAVLGIGLAAFVMLGAFSELAWRSNFSLRRLTRLPLPAFGTTLAHFGMGVTLLGIVCASAFEQNTNATLKPSESFQVGDYELVFLGLETRAGSNYDEEAAQFAIRRGGVLLGPLESSKRLYKVKNSATTEAGLATFGVSQLYLTLSEARGKSVVVRGSYKPLILLIWTGCLVMALGGLVSLVGRRLRWKL